MLTISNFSDRLADTIPEKQSVLCGGMDAQLRFMPPYLRKEAAETFGCTWRAVGELYFDFFRRVIDVIHDLVCCVKPQRAFYEMYGQEGNLAYERIVGVAHRYNLQVIQDAKRNDGGDTADAYAQGYLGNVPIFDEKDPSVLTWKIGPVHVDAMTITPYIGEDCVSRFVKQVKEFGTGVFVVTKTSFKPNSFVEQLFTESGCPVWREVARMVGEWGEGTEGSCGLRNVGVVMGATYPNDAVVMREILPNSWFLVPGYGAQGGGADGAVVGVLPNGLGAVVNSSRGLTYPFVNKDGTFKCDDDRCFDMIRQEAIRSRDELAVACKKAGKWSF